MQHKELRFDALLQERHALRERRDALQEWLPLNVLHTDFCDKVTEVHVLQGRIDTITARIDNLKQDLPEMGEASHIIIPIPTPKRK